MLTHKACTKCQVMRSLGDFHKGGGPGGVACRCKECTNAWDREKYHANREASIARVSAYNKAHPEKHAEAARRYRVRHPNKESAHAAVEKALRQGLLAPTACQGCGQVGGVEAHHHSYQPEHWLDVIWLCSACHMALHRAPRVVLQPLKLA
jgi:hypothetical protein